MPGVVSSLGYFLGAAVLLLGCGQSAVSAPVAPARDVETRVQPLKPMREVPRLLAPPPGYGNKVVMAQRESGNQTE